MNNFEQPIKKIDPLQEKFNEKLEAAGIELGSEKRNRLWTDEEWFQNKYTGQDSSEFPERIFKNVSEERIVELKEKYKNQMEKTEDTQEELRFDL